MALCLILHQSPIMCYIYEDKNHILFVSSEDANKVNEWQATRHRQQQSYDKEKEERREDDQTLLKADEKLLVASLITDGPSTS